MNIIAIIPARGGSKGLPRKNVLSFNGEPLVVHSIKYAQNCDLINKVYVSTNDDEISSISSSASASIIQRPLEFSGDTATTESAIIHAISMMDSKPDIIVLLQATSPFRPKNSLKEALEKFIKNDFDSLLSISPTHRFFWSIDGNDNISPNYDYLNRSRRQDLKRIDTQFVENGSLYIFTYAHFLSVKNRLGGKIGYIEFAEKYSHEIDTELDFKILEALVKNESN
ncbi:MAG: acylneuraminate cytidylyltransferase family protein [Candidatus Marinimicrobia bacterium]|jgi:CMP-N,N'-diacetyllegionaminic acid synthase|nr:acylneuraminate cytidylyltransferase family protein [Candidatus Neomarinimicrobiota bacterium]MBT7376723.1 acylneuraminate cytidylyltransferase family protein [Candidatus Neomarinimicrobiota bacterium]